MILTLLAAATASKRPSLAAAAVAFALSLAATGASHAADADAPSDGPADASAHEGYYYPAITSTETYKSRARVLDGSDRRRRLQFVGAMTVSQLAAPYPPPYLLFAKGDGAEKLIIVGMQDGWLDTPYRMRALLAMFTQAARQTPVLRDYGVDDLFTFYDLARLLGFAQITITDGRQIAHRVVLE